MICLGVWIEIRGEHRRVGDISGRDAGDACFTYADAYLEAPDSKAISISLPLEAGSFTPSQTRNFFEGLLPEGFTRRCVAQWLQADQEDYLTILSELGRECLGAIQILEEDKAPVPAAYRPLTLEKMQELAREGATASADIVTKSHLSLTGASGKVGLYYDEVNDQWYQPVGSAPSTHIVKQSHIRLQKIVANEQLCLLTAQNLGIRIPESFIIRTDAPQQPASAGDEFPLSGLMASEDTLLFATRRYDRIFAESPRYLGGLPLPLRLHQEDFAQALGIASADKYEKKQEGYLKKMFDLLRRYSSSPIEDQLQLWDICIFNYLVGNTDNHIKNLSLLYGPDLKTLRLSPAYDIISTQVYDSSTENMAVSIGNTYNLHAITRDSFASEAQNIGLGQQIAMRRYDRMAAAFPKALLQARDSLGSQLPEVEKLAERILGRARKFPGN